MPKLKYVVLHCGYVESSHTSPLILEYQFANKTFSSRRKAVEDLTLRFFEKFLYDIQWESKMGKRKECCKKATGNFCPQCGMKLTGSRFDFDTFEDFICEIAMSRAENFGNEINNWSAYCMVSDMLGKPSKVVEIYENAEKALIACLNPDELPEEFRAPLLKWKKENDSHKLLETHELV